MEGSTLGLTAALHVHYCMTDRPKRGGLEPQTQCLWIGVSGAVWPVTLTSHSPVKVQSGGRWGCSPREAQWGLKTAPILSHFTWSQAGA